MHEYLVKWKTDQLTIKWTTIKLQNNKLTWEWQLVFPKQKQKTLVCMHCDTPSAYYSDIQVTFIYNAPNVLIIMDTHHNSNLSELKFNLSWFQLDQVRYMKDCNNLGITFHLFCNKHKICDLRCDPFLSFDIFYCRQLQI